MNLCKDCRFYSGGDCMHDRAIRKIDPVSGHLTREAARSFREYGTCGRDGIFFERKVRVSFFIRLAWRLSR
jgi:hypothetical protein